MFKQALQEGGRLQSALNQQLATLDRAQKNYEKAFREAERAEDAYRKADADLNLSRADVEKHRINSSIKSHQCDDNKNEYAKQLQKTNELQTQHYQVLLFVQLIKIILIITIFIQIYRFICQQFSSNFRN